MSTCKALLSKIINKNAFYEQEDVTQNIFAFRVVGICILFYSFVMILNCLHIFIVDQTIFTRGYVAACVLVLIYGLLLVKMGLEHPFTKYLSVTAIGLIVMVASASLTYHMIIIMMIPIIIASMYTSKRLSVYAFIFTVGGITISTYVGYYFGVCDANMALLTVTSLDHLQKDGVFLLNKVNENPMVTLALYYVMPRSLMAVAFYYVSNSVNSIVRKSMENAMRMVQAASMDDMTGLYSKNKLLETVEHMEPKERPVVVIYWDVNQLKYLNDTFGHLYGDQLIAKIAGSIRAAVTSEETNAYRYGGDEFLMIIPDGTQEIAEDVIEKWRQVMKPIQKNSEIPVSASVGYAVGKYENIMELIEIAGYTENEKEHIAKEHLIPKQMEENGIEKGKLTIQSAALKKIINNYTKEAGVRNLERTIGQICRKTARLIMEEDKKKVTVTSKNLSDFLGKEHFNYLMANKKDEIGISRGLAWTQVGGDTLQIEVNVMPGKGELMLTGQLGDVMKESAQAGITYIRSIASDYKVEPEFFQENDIHVHIPEGAVPKDGPSAGITMATAILSAIIKKPVRADLAMTGEITLRGRVLPIGGLKEKLLAAKYAKIKEVLVPAENKPDIQELDKEITDGLTITFVSSMKEVLNKALV